MRNKVSNNEPACRAEDENQYEFMNIRFSGEETSSRDFFNLFDFIFISFVLDMYFLSLFTLGANKKRKKVPKKEKNQLGFQNSSSSLYPVRALFAKQTFTSPWLVCAYSA